MAHLEKCLPPVSTLLYDHRAMAKHLLDRLPPIDHGLRGGDHVEGDWKSTAIVHIVQPQLCPGELPLYITVGLFENSSLFTLEKNNLRNTFNTYKKCKLHST